MAMTKSILQKTIRTLTSKSSLCTKRFMSAAPATLEKQELEGNVASYYGKNANYAGLFGTNIHFGYFPHISNNNQQILTFAESGSKLTEYMSQIASIDQDSNVIDFGCGVGGPIYDVTQLTNCKATGIDLTKEYIEQANEQFGSKSDRIKYEQGSITALPANIKNGPKFSHVFSIQAICHIARFFDDVLREAYNVLDTNGIIVINDFCVAENGPTEKASAHFYKRLHFDYLLTFADYVEGLTNNGFDIIKFENCSQHATYGYDILSPQAKQNNNIESDGISLAEHYKETSQCFKRGELGMVVIVARKK